MVNKSETDAKPSAEISLLNLCRGAKEEKKTKFVK